MVAGDSLLSPWLRDSRLKPHTSHHTHTPTHHIPVRSGWSHKGFFSSCLSLVHGLSDRDRGCMIASCYGGNGRDMDMDGDSPYERREKKKILVDY